MIIVRLLPAIFILALTFSTSAQDQSPAPATTSTGPTVRLRGLGSYQFEADIDSGGDMKVSRFGSSLDLNWSLDKVTALDVRLGYEYSDYSFSGPTTFGSDTLWDDVHNGSARALFTWLLNDELSIFAGGFVSLAWEAGADVDDGVTGGGVLGATLVVDDSLTWGFGLAVASQIQDGALWWPVPIIEWSITDALHLTTRTPFPSSTGIELNYDLGQGMVVGVGAGYHLRRFRLDGDGLSPDGVGEEKSLPVWVRLGFDISDTTTISIMAGFVAAGKLEMENANGSILDQQDYDPAGLVAVTGSIRF